MTGSKASMGAHLGARVQAESNRSVKRVMRIIAGTWKGLRLFAPQGNAARPTTDRVKESMFQLLGVAWPGGAAVDLFAGSGALGLEALSRGANHAYLIDNNRTSLMGALENVRHCKAEDLTTLWNCDWKTGWQRVATMAETVAWVFVDPPYGRNLWDEVLTVIGAHPGPLQSGVVCEHPALQIPAAAYGCLQQWKTKRYGDIGVSVYRVT